jgi:multidrug resistance protein, MATE family
MFKSRIMQLAIPMILSNLTVPLLGLVDTAVMGHLPHAYYLAAVGVAVMIFNFLYYSLGFLRMGTTGLMAQAFGSGDYQKAYDVMFRGIFIALLFGIIFCAAQYPLLNVGLYFAHPTATVAHYAAQYVHWRIWGAPAALVNFVFMGAFIGIHRPKYALLTMTFVNVLAIILDLVLVFGLHMRVTGVALSAVVSQYLGAVVAAFFVCRFFSQKAVHFNVLRVMDVEKIKQLFHLNKDIFLRTLAIIMVFAFFTRASVQLGVTVLAANMILLNFQDIMAFGLDGFANAAEALIGEAYGQSDRAMFLAVLKNTGVYSFMVAIVFSGVYWLFGAHIIHIMTGIHSVRKTAHDFLVFAIMSPIVSVWSYWLDGVLIGATQSKLMRNTMLVAMLIFFVVYYVLQGFSNTGLWIALLSFMLARALAMAPFIRKIIPGRSCMPTSRNRSF